MFRFLSVLICLPFLALAQENPKLYRQYMYEASKDADAANMFSERMKKADTSNALQLAYQAMSDMMQSYHAFNPYTKLSHFFTGKSKLERAVQKAPDNAEIRFLRYTIQKNVPAVLQYNQSLQSDQIIIHRYLSARNGDEDLKKRIRDYLNQ